MLLFYGKERRAAAALSSLMSQSHDTMVCIEFVKPVDPAESQQQIDEKLRDAVIVDASKSFASYFGFKHREDVIGKHMMDLSKNSVPSWFRGYGQEVERRDFDNIERIVSVPVGDTTRKMRINMQNIFRDDLLVMQWIFLRDISEDEARKQALVDSERLKRLALDAGKLKTFTLRIGPKGSIESVNPGDDPLGQPGLEAWKERMHTEDRISVKRKFNEFVKGKTKNLHLLFRVGGFEGNERWFEMWGTATGHDSKNRVLGVAGVYQDRTDEKAIERKMQSVQRLESLGILAGGIAHDFNNLLMTIVGAAEMARVNEADVSVELDRIDQTAEQAALLCNQLLTYAGQGSAGLETLDVSVEISKLTELLQLSIHENANLNMSLSDNCWVRGDIGQLTQVVMNLVNNASDALEGKPGEITVRLSLEPIQKSWYETFHLGETLSSKIHVCFEVTDTGVGMSAEQLSKLFDPFYTTKFTGRGLGMAVVMGVVKSHDGAIGVQSQPGSGTTIKVLLPVVDEPKQEVAPKEEDTISQLQGHVLVVDDVKQVRQIFEKLLSALGVSVTSLDSAEQAVALLQDDKHPFDVVIMDITMPGMDGIEAAHLILESSPDTKIILSSGYSRLSVPEVLRDRVSFIQKPFRLNQLFKKLSPILTSD